MKIDKYDAINAIYEGNVTQLSDGTFEYHSGGSIPTEEAIQSKLAELQAEYDSKKYQRDRKYPDLGEQFDLLFKDINSGKVSKDGGFYKAIKAVKEAHPKPSE
tara:strand:+ start:1913 stop:2221 length:309 start_codon:yes stop_codon:yes gene_type:complete